MTDEMRESLRRLPAMNRILDDERMMPLCREFGRRRVRGWTRAVLSRMRTAGSPSTEDDAEEQIVSAIAEEVGSLASREGRPRLRRVINGTGVILHTNLGRAPLARAAEAAIAETAGYSNLELDLDTGSRGQRTARVESLWRELTGAEAAIVVNNCAAATWLTLRCLARGREVIVSRGQLVEIGGSYRLPDVFEEAGVHLREVGTTNKTHLADYERAVSEETAAILRVHQSNFRQVGFTQTVPTAELCELARRHSLPLIDDIGSGCVTDLSGFGLRDEPSVGRSLDDGADLVLFSGDKLFGGPQCGMVLGRAEIVQGIRSSPLLRALRVDKLTLAALEATLTIHLSGRPLEEIPVLRAIAQPADSLRRRAERIREQLPAALQSDIAIEPMESTIGGGSLPGDMLPSWGIMIRQADCAGTARELRIGEPAVMTRVCQGAICIDLRTVAADEDEMLVDAMIRSVEGG